MSTAAKETAWGNPFLTDKETGLETLKFERVTLWVKTVNKDEALDYVMQSLEQTDDGSLTVLGSMSEEFHLAPGTGS